MPGNVPETPPPTPGGSKRGPNIANEAPRSTGNVHNQGINNNGGVVAGNAYGYSMILGVWPGIYNMCLFLLLTSSATDADVQEQSMSPSSLRPV
jgi:hypothetical protein